jgi:nicotinate phosphoribosyltransferase
VGGCNGTSNAQAGKLFGLPVRGTQAHSWIQAFPDELASFRSYAATFPESTILLVDTYDTLKSGVPHAIIVAHELREQGRKLLGIRIDSGDLAYLSREARQMLDTAGLKEVKIVVSNDMDEFVIESVRSEGGRVDIYGVGTSLVTCAGAGGGALGGVYKLVEIDGKPKLKVTGDFAKSTLPGKKRVIRFVAPDGDFIQDVVCLDGETITCGDTVYDPANPLQHTTIPSGAEKRELREVVMVDGCRRLPKETLADIADRCREELTNLTNGCVRLINPHRYKVSMSDKLTTLRGSLINKIKNNGA